ncbi:hypothetical protein M8J77_000411 [Diaphorina citri]|nr:hypothetical protein M8J77_000411 [Diaphorina citri]
MKQDPLKAVFTVKKLRKISKLQQSHGVIGRRRRRRIKKKKKKKKKKEKKKKEKKKKKKKKKKKRLKQPVPGCEPGGSSGPQLAMQIWGPEVAMVMLLVVGALGVDPLTTTTNSMAGRGEKKFGDKCVETKECGVENSFCDEGSKQCQCLPEFSVTNHYDKCGTVAEVGADCFFNEQCEAVLVPTECRDRKCTCKYELEAVKQPDGTFICKTPYVPTEETYVDPAMILVLVVMALMFIIICVVLHLFSK